MATKYAYEFGKRWDARIPRDTISWKIGKLHVSTSDEEIEVLIKDRCAKNPNFTPSLTRQSVAYAIACHNKNRDLYHRVASGRI